MNKIIYMCYVCLFFVGISCSGSSSPEDEPEKGVANQTLIFYIQSNNSLYRQLWAEMDEVQKVYRGKDNNNVLVFIDSEAGSDVGYDSQGQWIPRQTVVKNQLFLVTGGNMTPVEGFEEQFKGRASSDMNTFKDVLNYCAKEFPAEKYGLVLGAHGTGWAPVSRVIGGNDYTDVYMETKDVAKTLPFKFEYIVFDACLMNDMATLYEFRDKANYIIASPANIPAAGFKFSVSLKYLLQNDLVKVCEKYIEDYILERQCAMITLTRTEGLEEVARLNKQLFMKYSPQGKDKEILRGIQRYEANWSYVDYLHFLGVYIGIPENPEERVQTALDKVCLYTKWTGIQPRDFKVYPEYYSGYSHWLYQGVDPDLDELKTYQWYKDAGLDLFMDEINDLYK